MKESTTIAFTGDIGFDKYMDKKWEDDALLAPGILEFLTSADHVVANVEGPLVDNTATLMQAAEMRLMHTINPAAERVLKDIHADIWNLCNNHTNSSAFLSCLKVSNSSSKSSIVISKYE